MNPVAVAMQRVGHALAGVGWVLVVVLIVAGCGRDQASAPFVSPEQSAGDTASPEILSEDEAAIQAAVTAFLLEGDCDAMTDEFLSDQTIGIGGTSREKSCETFTMLFSAPQYTAEDLVFSDFTVEGATGSVILSDYVSDIEVRYLMVDEDGTWRIASVDFL